MTTDLNMWDYWLDKRGCVMEALECDFPELAKKDEVLRTALAMMKTGEASIRQRMRELQDAEGKYLSGAVFALPLNKIIAKLPVIIPPTESIDSAYEKMIKEKVEAVLIVEYDTKVVGILTERDFLTKVIGKSLWGKGIEASALMSNGPMVLYPRHKIAHGINNMFLHKHRHVVIVDEEKCPIGPISVLEILHFIYHRIFPLNRRLENASMTDLKLPRE